MRVPFLAAGPGVARGVASDALVGLQDILPTLASAAGAKVSHPVQGADLSEVLAAGRGSPRELYYSQTGASPRQSSMVCDGAWKYIYTEWGGIEELYDQIHDLPELHNRARDPACTAQLAQGRRWLRECATELGDTSILTADGFAVSPLDRQAIRQSPIRGMGWRFY